MIGALQMNPAWLNGKSPSHRQQNYRVGVPEPQGLRTNALVLLSGCCVLVV